MVPFPNSCWKCLCYPLHFVVRQELERQSEITWHSYRPQLSCGKVMFSQVSVILFTAGGGGMCGRGVCMAGGHVWQRSMHGGCMAGGIYGGEDVWQGCVCGRGACVVGACMARGACVAGETATAADGTHPTGMHSSLHINFCRTYTRGNR